jgi:hypothetical protein
MSGLYILLDTRGSLLDTTSRVVLTSALVDNSGFNRITLKSKLTKSDLKQNKLEVRVIFISGSILCLLYYTDVINFELDWTRTEDLIFSLAILIVKHLHILELVAKNQYCRVIN